MDYPFRNCICANFLKLTKFRQSKGEKRQIRSLAGGTLRGSHLNILWDGIIIKNTTTKTRSVTITPIQQTSVRIIAESTTNSSMPPSMSSSTAVTRKAESSCSEEDSIETSSFYGKALDRKSSLSSQTSATTITATTNTNTTHTSLGAEDVSARRIRMRYFHKLGLVGNPPLPAVSILPTPTSSSSSTKEQVRVVTAKHNSHPPATKKDLRPLHSCTDSLKGDLKEQDCTLTRSSPPQQQHSHHNSADSKVSFQSKVRVHWIPHRHQYSPQTKQLLWMSLQELEEMAFRNCIEFASEGWDWRQAVEEVDFVLVQGTFHHPAFHQYAWMLQEQKLQQDQHLQFVTSRQFCRIFSAQRQQLSRKQQYLNR